MNQNLPQLIEILYFTQYPSASRQISIRFNLTSSTRHTLTQSIRVALADGSSNYLWRNLPHFVFDRLSQFLETSIVLPSVQLAFEVAPQKEIANSEVWRTGRPRIGRGVTSRASSHPPIWKVLIEKGKAAEVWWGTVLHPD